MSTLPILALALLHAVSNPPADRSERSERPDLIVFQDGRSIECRVLREDAETLVYREGRKQRETPRADVAQLRTLERSLAELLDRMASADRTDVSALSELALVADSLGLPGEATNLRLRVLALDPSNEPAWKAVGGVERRDVWQLDLDGQRYGIDELRTRGASARHPLVLRTAHFVLESDLPLLRVLDAALDVERTYLAFYQLLGPHLELYVFEESPRIRLFRDVARQPSPPRPGDLAWFDGIANTLFVRDVPGRDVRAIVAELTDALLFNAFCRSSDRRNTGAIDGWARAGLGQMFGAAVRGAPGCVTFDFRTPSAPHFRLQAGSAEEMTLERLLRSGHGAFDTGPDEKRFEAAAYTLLHFLAFADGGKHSASLGAYAGDAYAGKSGPTKFSKRFGKDLERLEAEWTAYVRRIAGA